MSEEQAEQSNSPITTGSHGPDLHHVTVVDHRPGTDAVAIWLVVREELRAVKTNAVVIDLAGDPEATDKVRWLTGGSPIALTDGSHVGGLSVDDNILAVNDFHGLIDETLAHQREISAAVEAYRRRIRSRTISEPDFPPTPTPESLVREADTAPLRTLAAANFVQAAWTAWLRSDEERRRRTVNPRTQTSPWMMPEELGSPLVPDFPPGFAARLRVRPQA